MSDISEPVESLFSEDELKNVRAIKLINGEDILAILMVIEQDVMIVKRPCKVIRVVNNDGTVTIILLKWHIFASEDLFPIQMSSVVSWSKIKQEMVDYYINSVKKQVIEETENKLPVEPPNGYQWPEWMDEAITSKDKTKLN